MGGQLLSSQSYCALDKISGYQMRLHKVQPQQSLVADVGNQGITGDFSPSHDAVEGGPTQDISGGVISGEQASFTGRELQAPGFVHAPVLAGIQDGGTSHVHQPLSGEAFHAAIDVEACDSGKAEVGVSSSSFLMVGVGVVGALLRCRGGLVLPLGVS